MGSAEVGATTSLFPFASTMIPYLELTSRHEIAVAAATIASSPGPSNLLQADVDAEYDEVITIDLSALEPHINGYVFSRPFYLSLASRSGIESIYESKML